MRYIAPIPLCLRHCHEQWHSELPRHKKSIKPANAVDSEVCGKLLHSQECKLCASGRTVQMHGQSMHTYISTHPDYVVP